MNISKKIKGSGWYNHLKTINEHKIEVGKNCFRCGLYKQGLLHDLSKYSWTEFSVGAKYYQGNRSPNEAEREDKGYTSSWLHHKGRNKHHLEYWIDYDIEHRDRGMTGMKMPDNYIVEMFCDRVAASKTYNGKNYTDSDPYNYFMKGKARRVIHPETSKLIEDLLYMLKTKGEDETFAYIRGLKEEENRPVDSRGISRRTTFTVLAVAIIAASAGVGVYSAVDSVVGNSGMVENADTPDTADTVMTPDALEDTR